MDKTHISGRPLPAVACGVLGSFLLMLLLSLLCAIVIYCSSLSEGLYGSCSVVIIIVGSFIGAFLAARLNGCRGLLIGLITAAILAALAMLLGGAELRPLLKILCYLLPGMAGGVFGVSGAAAKSS